MIKMNRCDFSSIMNIIRRYVSDDYEMGQLDLVDLLFASFCMSDIAEDFAFDNGQVCRWMNGQARISPKISGYYATAIHQKQLAEDIENDLIPILTDSSMACKEIYDLVTQDASISWRKKRQLAKECPPPEDKAEALFIASILCFGMGREFVKRPSNAKALPTSGITSPVISEHIFGADVPRPCRHFCGREEEISELHDLLVNNQKVFITGMPGIGKSELAKAYAKAHRTDYTNIIYITYSGDLRKDIADIDFADDPLLESDQERFINHDRFLCTLREDSLLIIDNFNTTAAAERTLRSIKRYSCRVLFTSRSRWSHYPSLGLTEIRDMSSLLSLTGSLYSELGDNESTVIEIIETVHRHTLAVELAARLLENGILTPEELLHRFETEKAAMSVSDKVNVSKDGHTKKQTYYAHIHLLFSLYKLSDEEQEIMRSMTFVPITGISRRLLAKWLLLQDMNVINDLVETGFILPKPGHSIALHPMVQEVALADLKPSITNCSTLFDSLHGICILHGIDVPWYRMLFHVIEQIVLLIDNDDVPSYLCFIEDAVQYMDNYMYVSGIKVLQERLRQLLKDPSVGTDIDRALFLNNQAYLETDPKKMIPLYKKALKLLPEVNMDTALLVSNLHANAGNMYRITGNYSPAKEHMDAALHILKEYELDNRHDAIIQFVNYGLLLKDLCRYDEALKFLLKAKEIAAFNMGQESSDYARIQEAIGVVFLESGNVNEGAEHLKQAAQTYETLYEGDEELIQSKYQQFRSYYIDAGIVIGKHLRNAEPQQSLSGN
ncbi:MAG: ATP-binding protein [Mogibacterium sp.]|nr:ATP-binding protein [Mogibacterium sp.]